MKIEKLTTEDDLLSPEVEQNLWPVVDHMPDMCPVLRDHGRFGSGRHEMVPPPPPGAPAPDGPPIDLDPPDQHDREVLNPHLPTRVCRVDTEVGGHTVREGERVPVQLGGANHDGSEVERPSELDLDRPRNEHVAFRAGPHRCVGSHLGRTSLRIALEEVLSRPDDISLTDPDQVRIGASLQAYGLEYMPIRSTPHA